MHFSCHWCVYVCVCVCFGVYVCVGGVLKSIHIVALPVDSTNINTYSHSVCLSISVDCREKKCMLDLL